MSALPFHPLANLFPLLDGEEFDAFVADIKAHGLRQRIVLCGCTLHEKNNRFWIGLPAKPYTTDSGSQSWVKLIDFEDKKTHERFQEIMTPLAIAALEQARGAA